MVASLIFVKDNPTPGTTTIAVSPLGICTWTAHSPETLGSIR